jgi:hypothetical protein
MVKSAKKATKRIYNDKAKDSLVIVVHTEINADLTGSTYQLNLSPEASAFT